MAPKWKSSIPIAGVAAVAALAFPGIASAAVTPRPSTAPRTDGRRRARNDAISIACVNGANVDVHGATVTPATACANVTAINVTGGGAFDNVISLVGVTKALFPARRPGRDQRRPRRRHDHR